MHADAVALIRAHARAVEVLPTREAARLDRLAEIEAIVFDVYGTLFSSASGDIGLTASGDRQGAMIQALEAEGIPAASAGPLPEHLDRLIREDHARSLQGGVDFPEVEIREIWKQALLACALRPSEAVIERLAVRYESLINPVWPMPGARATLVAIRERGFALGIISNAQFYTPPLFEALLETPLERLGFDPELCLWSYREREAKPSLALFEQVAGTLGRRGIDARSVLYVGNDMRNDIATGAAVGFKTALFAGDARSLRWRREAQLAVVPDLVLTDLAQLLECVG